ncbi:hypothetical protein ETAA8_60730 [Anatilimnocola aggregata]|uniref:Uncharacterized protein n=1 Tax=Anatilimnocola aggregata TaxID=2528021 RepID=A0A517YL41_9BACT|nr:hypothetical protein [Anatilimnocola aggregata]QDU30920.1 hypothetical protein ETAA8_60730 [Anatilimnocola aggregata]
MSGNPFKFLGGMVLEIAAVVAVLALLPALGSREKQATALSQLSSAIPNQVFFDAKSARTLDLIPPTQVPHDQPVQSQYAPARSTPPAVWASDFSRPAPVAQQRFVEEMLDYNSQRAMDVATRVFQRGEELLPAELRVARQPANEIPRLVPEHNGYASNASNVAQRDWNQNELDRGQLIELPSSRPVASPLTQAQHPSFAETYQRPTQGNYAPNPSKYGQSDFGRTNRELNNYGQSPAEYGQSSVEQPVAPASNYGTSYYSRTPAAQTAEPRVRQYDGRY